MKTAEEIEDMVARFDVAHENDQLEGEGEVVRDVLCWVLDLLPDYEVVRYLPEEEETE